MHHLPFEVASVDDAVKPGRICAEAIWQSISKGRVPAGVQFVVESRDPDNHRLEVYWGIDRIPPGQKSRPAHEWKGAHSLEAAIADPVSGQDTSLQDPSLLTR